MTRMFSLLSATAALAITAVAAPSAMATAPDGAAALGLGADARVQATSPFYAGYADQGVGSDVTRADFRVPQLTCDGADNGIAITLYAISEEGEFLAGSDLF